MANEISIKNVKAVIDSLVRSNKVGFVQLYVSVDGSGPEEEDCYTDWRDYVHVKGGAGNYNPDLDDPWEYVKSAFSYCDNVTILRIEFKNTEGTMISTPVEC